MERLRRHDLVGLLGLVKEVYACRDAEALIATVLSRLPTLVFADIRAWNESDPFGATISYVVEPADSNPPGGAEVLCRYMDEHPIVAHYRRTQDGHAVMISDFLTRTEYHRTGLYNEFFRHAYPRVEDLVSVNLSEHLTWTSWLVVTRDRRTFTERDRTLMNSLRSHLRQARLNIEALEASREGARQAAAESRIVDREFVALGTDDRIISATPRAHAWLKEHFGADMSGAVPEKLLTWVKAQQMRINVPDLETGPPLPLRLEGDRPLVVRLVPDGGGTTLVMAKPRRSVGPSAFQSLGLTDRETDVLLWVSRGKTNAEIAANLNIRPKTVEKHLERIFERLGVENRTAAAARALELLYGD